MLQESEYLENLVSDCSRDVGELSHSLGALGEGGSPEVQELEDGLHVDGTTQQFLIVPQPLNMAGKESAEKIQLGSLTQKNVLSAFSCCLLNSLKRTSWMIWTPI